MQTRDNPLNPAKLPIEWIDAAVEVSISNQLLDTDYDAAVQLGLNEVERKMFDLLVGWEDVDGGAGILYGDSSGVDETKAFHQNEVVFKVQIHIDLTALDQNTRTIGGYVEEAKAKFELIMSIYRAGIERGIRKGSAATRALENFLND
jgi:hypothetical protein